MTNITQVSEKDGNYIILDFQALLIYSIAFACFARFLHKFSFNLL